MSVGSELRVMRWSFSADRSATARQRSGESEESGAPLLDFFAHTQSAEDDIIEAEERTEQREAKRDFARLLGLYYKKILSPVEFKFFAASIRSKKTPYAIGRALGVDYEPTISSIKEKHRANLPKLKKLMALSGYNFRRGLVLLPDWARYVKRRAQIRQTVATFRSRHPERAKEQCRRWRETHKEELKGQWAKWWAQCSEEHKAEVLRRKREKRAANREEFNASQRARYADNREAVCARQRERYKNLTPEQREAKRERGRVAQARKRAANREAYNEYQRRYRAEHREQYRSYENNRRREARKSWTPEQLEADRAKARERSARNYTLNKEKKLAACKAYREKRKLQKEEVLCQT